MKEKVKKLIEETEHLKDIKARSSCEECHDSCAKIRDILSQMDAMTQNRLVEVIDSLKSGEEHNETGGIYNHSARNN